MTDHSCAPPATADNAQSWSCPGCGQLWEALPQQPAEQVEHIERADYEEATMDKSSWALVVLVASVPLAVFSEWPALTAALCVVGLLAVVYWFWQFFRR